MRTWICNGCGHTVNISYNELTIAGNPICIEPGCSSEGEEMELLSCETKDSREDIQQAIDLLNLYISRSIVVKCPQCMNKKIHSVDDGIPDGDLSEWSEWYCPSCHYEWSAAPVSLNVKRAYDILVKIIE